MSSNKNDLIEQGNCETGDNNEAISASNLQFSDFLLQNLSPILSNKLANETYLTAIKFYLVLITANVLLFHIDKLLFNLVLLGLFSCGYFYHLVISEKTKQTFSDYMKTRRQKSPHSGGLLRLGGYYELLNENEIELKSSSTSSGAKMFQFDQKSLTNLNFKPTLTDSYSIDDELHKIIELVIRDYVDSWYKENISSKEDFGYSIRVLIYNSLRQISQFVKTIDWEHFLMNIFAQNLIIQMRMYKKAKEKVKASASNAISNILSNSSANLSSFKSLSNQKSINESIFSTLNAMNAANEAALIDLFFELESDMEKNICRDFISSNSSDREKVIGYEKEYEKLFLFFKEIFQEISETLCYSLMSSRSFNCNILRCLVREIVANHLMKGMIEKICEPDYLNQTVLYLLQDHEADTEHFLNTIQYCDSVDELNELKIAIDQEILHTRSNDKGGHQDQEIKQTLSSLFYVRKRIEMQQVSLISSCVKNSISSPMLEHKNESNRAESMKLVSNSFDAEYKQYQFYASLSALEFELVIKNEDIQHCFIEFMGKRNVQNLISFYLNTEMYRRFALRELEKSKMLTEEDELKEIKQSLCDFAKGLINSYLLNAINFVSSSEDPGEEPINIRHRAFYKKELAEAIERLENSSRLDETVLDRLQFKIYLLMKEKYYPEFKNYPEFQKILMKNDLIFKLNESGMKKTSNDLQDNFDTASIGSASSLGEAQSNFDTDQSVGLASIDENKIVAKFSNDTNYNSNNTDSLSQASSDFSTDSSSIGNSESIQITAVITSCGRCNELNTVFAIYIIDVTKKCSTTNQSKFWQTYRRFNDFHDFHLIVKKRYPHLSNLVLPKSFRSSLRDEFLEKRRTELNTYLQILTSQENVKNNPGLAELVLRFLENKRWENANNNIKRKFDSLLSPMLNSVQNIQTTIKNAPENVIDIFKGLSDNLLFDNSPTSANDNRSFSNSANILNNNNTTNNNNSISFVKNKQQSLQVTPSSNNSTSNNDNQHSNNFSSSSSPLITRRMPTKSNSSSTTNDSLIDRQIFTLDELHSSNLPIKVLLLLLDEMFDLKEKNQWLRQSLMVIVKTFLKNFKGDSMNRKMKELIADYLGEENIAKYLKNFRKRFWPKGYLAEQPIDRSNTDKEITKILAKTKLLSLVSDELRTLIGNDTARAGVFTVFDLFQHKPMNKRFSYILMEYFLDNFCVLNAQSQLNNSAPSNSISSPMYPSPTLNYISSPLTTLIKLHLSKSSKVKSEYRLGVKKSNSEQFSANKMAQESKSMPQDAAKNNAPKIVHSNSMINSSFCESEMARKKSLNTIPKSQSFYADF